MKKIILLLFVSGLMYACQNSTSNSSGAQDYESKKMSVAEIERANPENFLDASGTYNGNFWGDKLKVHGTVTNKATVANYKDVVVRVTFYTATETTLDTKDYVIYDYFPAHSTKNFELNLSKPSACKKIGWDAVTATPN